MEKEKTKKLLEMLEKEVEEAPLSHWSFACRMLDIVKQFLEKPQDKETPDE